MDITASLKPTTKSQTLLLNEQSRNLEASGKKMVKFGFGQSPFLPPEHVMQALRDAVARKEYTSVQGLPELRKAAAQFHQQVDGIAFNPNRILVAPGSKILLYTVMASFTKADVLIPAPSWVSYAPQAELCGHRAIKVDTSFGTHWRVTPQNLQAALSQRTSPSTPAILILNYPSNPEGLTYSEGALAALSQVLKKHNVLVLSDEIYGLLHHQGKHVSLAKFYPEGTIVTTGLSKWCGAGGWRLGLALIPSQLPEAFVETCLGIASETYSCAPTPIQVAAITAYQWDKRIEGYLQAQRTILSAIGNDCQKTLAAGNIKVHPPEGAFYLFLDFTPFRSALARKGITTDLALCSRLIEDTGVALLPGTAFGMEAEALTARLAYVEFDGTQAIAALQQNNQAADATFLKSHAFRVQEGIAAIVSWCNNQ